MTYKGRPTAYIPPGKVPGIPAKTVHFPPWLVGVSALQPSLAALIVSTPGESAGNFRENGSLSPVARRGTGSTGTAGGTCRFHFPGKCREFPRKWFTFPRGRQGYRLYSHLWRHLTFLSLGESAGNFGENGSLSPAACRCVGSTAISRRTHRFHLREKCRVFRRKRFTFPRGLEKDRRSNGGIDVIGYSAPFSFSVLMLIHGDRLCGKGGFSRYFATFVV